jgi:hypothetical protein
MMTCIFPFGGFPRCSFEGKIHKSKGIITNDPVFVKQKLGMILIEKSFNL